MIEKDKQEKSAPFFWIYLYRDNLTVYFESTRNEREIMFFDKSSTGRSVPVLPES